MQFFMKINFHLNIKIVGFNQQEKFECSTSKSKDVNEYEIELRSKRPRIEKDFGPEYYVYNLQIQVFGKKPSMMRWIPLYLIILGNL